MYTMYDIVHIIGPRRVRVRVAANGTQATQNAN